jgi:transposase
MGGIRIPHRRGPARTRPGRVLGDKAYSNKTIRRRLRHQGIAVTIPEKTDQIRHRLRQGADGGRPYAFDRERYKLRNTVERAFSKLKHFRAVATRFDKREYMYYATVDIATIKIWLRDLALRS